MDQSELFQLQQRRQHLNENQDSLLWLSVTEKATVKTYLLHDGANVFQGQRAKLVLLEEIV